MRILIISDAWLPQLNGVVRTYEYLNKALEEAGHQVSVIGPAQFPTHFSMPGYKEIKLVFVPYARMVKIIEKYAPDSIHIATEGPLGWTARRYCRKNNVKFTSCYHTQFPDYAARRLSKFLPFFYKSLHKIGVKVIKRFHRRSSALLVTTKSMADELKNWGIKTPIHEFTRGVDTNLFHLGEKSLFQDLPQPVALYVGRLAIEKSVEEFLKMPWEGSKIVVGNGPDEKSLQKKYPNVFFKGKKTGKELADHYRSADVFVFPSRTDTFGIVLLEALACGLPIAAHDVIGPRDIITNDTLGYLDENLSRAAKKSVTIGNAQKRNEHVTKYYTWEKACNQFLTATEKTKT